MSWEDYEYYEDEEEETGRCRCTTCELKCRFAWIEEVFFVSKMLGSRNAGHSVVGDYLVFLSHSYPEGVEVESYFVSFLDHVIPDNIGLVLTIYEVDPDCRTLFDTTYKRKKVVKELINDQKTRALTNITPKTFIKKTPRNRRCDER